MWCATYVARLMRRLGTPFRVSEGTGQRMQCLDRAQTQDARPLRDYDVRPLTLGELAQLRQALARDWERARARMDMRACGQIAKDALEAAS